MELGQQPRLGEFAERNGAYEQAIRIKKTVIKPGESLNIEQFFTGYGEITKAKVSFYPSDDIFDQHESYILCDLGLDEEKKGIIFGRNKIKLMDAGSVFDLGGVMGPTWQRPTFFIDRRPGNPPVVITEAKLGNAPFSFHLKTLKNVRPGTYVIEFYFTYFNGDAWKSSSKRIEFKVQNFFERNDRVLGGLAIFGTVTALLKFWVSPFLPELSTNHAQQSPKAAISSTVVNSPRPASVPLLRRPSPATSAAPSHS